MLSSSAAMADKAKMLKPLGNVGQITAVAGDALQDDVLEKVIAPADMDCEFNWHIGAIRQQNFKATQAELPARIAKIASQHNVSKIVHISAIGADAKSKSQYAVTKAEGERASSWLLACHDIMRPSIIFGPGDGFFNRFGQMAMFAPALPLIGGGKNKMQPVYVGDVSDAVIASLANRETDDQIFELGGPKAYSFKRANGFDLRAIGRRRALVSVPFALMHIPASIMQFLPSPPLTRDQLYLLEQDNVVGARKQKRWPILVSRHNLLKLISMIILRIYALAGALQANS